MSETTDTALVERVREGDMQAYAELVRRYQGPVLGFAINYLKDRQAAGDVAQEVFLKAYKAIRTYETRNQAVFSTWLFAIARNACIDELRKARRDHDSLESEDPLPRVEPSQTLDVDRGRFNSLLEEALGALSLKHREAFDLTFVQGLSFVEAASVLDSNAFTIRSRAEKARSHLMKKLRRFKEWSET